jgi:hypothetical protein
MQKHGDQQRALTKKKMKYNMSRGRDVSGLFMVRASVIIIVSSHTGYD